MKKGTSVEKTAATVKGKPGRKPMTPEEKEAAANARAEEKAKAENLRPEVFIQYQGEEISVTTLEEAVKAAFHKEKPRTLVTDLKVYVKPEERTAYYVINGDHTGDVKF